MQFIDDEFDVFTLRQNEIINLNKNTSVVEIFSCIMYNIDRMVDIIQRGR